MGARRLRRGVYLLPTVFTVGNLFCGFVSVANAAAGQLDRAALLIIFAGVLDALDGRIARMTGSTSEFGLQFDSLADVVSFGVAPAFLAFQWSPLPRGNLGFAFVFVACAALRLARFNIQPTAGSEPKRHFAGLPSPAAAGLVASVVFAFPGPTQVRLIGEGRMALVTIAALLMVSRFRYRSFKDFDLRSRRPFRWVLAIVGIVTVVRFWPEGTLLLMASAYALSAPAAWIWTLMFRRKGAGLPPAVSEEVVDGGATR